VSENSERSLLSYLQCAVWNRRYDAYSGLCRLEGK